MRKFLLVSLTSLLVCCSAMGQQTQPQAQPQALSAAMGQQMQPQQPQALTFFYDYRVNPGQEEEFMNLIKTVGAPVRDKLLAEGVILAWGMEVPVLRSPGGPTHTIWFSVLNLDGVEKVLTAMEVHLAKLAADEAKAVDSAHASKQKPAMTTAMTKGMTTAERQRAVFDMS